MITAQPRLGLAAILERRAYREAEAHIRAKLAAIPGTTEGVSEVAWPAKLRGGRGKA